MVATVAVGMHPTGMHPCIYISVAGAKVWFHQALPGDPTEDCLTVGLQIKIPRLLIWQTCTFHYLSCGHEVQKVKRQSV